MHNISCSVVLVGTSGKGYNSVILCKLYVVGEIGTGLELLQEVQIIRTVFKIDVICIGV